MSDKKLFSEFPSVPTSKWEEVIQVDLKGADYEKKLVWKTNEGFNIRPYYRSEDLESLGYLNVLPGEFPFVRGKKIQNNDWTIRQDFRVRDAKQANEAAVEALKKGANAVGFFFCAKTGVPDFSVLLKDIDTTKSPVHFYVKKDPVAFLKALLNNQKDPRGVLFFDPLSTLATCGTFAGEKQLQVADIKEMIELTKDLTCFRVLGANAGVFQNAGSTAVQELAYALAMGVEYLDALTEAGCKASCVAKNIKFQFAVGSNYFMEIAKLRAARLLWANIVKSYEGTCPKCQYMNIHAETARWNMTMYDQHVNILRTATESMAAVIAGADSVTTLPFNTPYGTKDEMAERIARNQQIILKEESNFSKISDPAAGSYYIENLTDSIASYAWELFLEIEDKGGYVKAMKEGFIQAQVKEAAASREAAVEKRKEVLLGTNQYANVKENIAANVKEDEGHKCCQAEKVVEPIAALRLADTFEQLRLKTERSGKSPKVFLLTIGDLKMRKARAGFALNFFSVAGFQVIDNNGFASIEEGVKAAKEANSDIVVLCSSDDEYPTFAGEAVKAVGDSAVFVLAGYPKAILDELKAAGVENFIYAGQNVLEALAGYQTKLGIA